MSSRTKRRTHISYAMISHDTLVVVGDTDDSGDYKSVSVCERGTFQRTDHLMNAYFIMAAGKNVDSEREQVQYIFIKRQSMRAARTVFLVFKEHDNIIRAKLNIFRR